MYKYSFRIEINWSTLKSTGEILTKQATNANMLIDPSQVEYHTEIVEIASVSAKRDYIAWEMATNTDISKSVLVAEIKAKYPENYYYLCGAWHRE